MEPKDKPTLEELARACRFFQKEYFATRDRGALMMAKAAEATLDKRLAELAGEQARAPDLFDTTRPEGGA